MQKDLSMFDALKRAIRVVHEGNTYFGFYKIHNDLVEVEYKGKTASTRFGQHDPFVVADILMVELVKSL